MAETKLKNQSLDTTTRLSSKIITATRDITAASGDVSYTGVGFKPTSIIAFSAIDGTQSASFDFSDSLGASNGIGRNAMGYMYGGDANVSGKIVFGEVGAGFATAIIKTYDTDGFTLTWVKSGTPGAGTLYIKFLCFR